MPGFIKDLKTFLEQRGYENLFIDSTPPKGHDFIAIYQYAHRFPEPHYGISTRYIRVIVCRKDGAEAERVAGELLALLDSGANEDFFEIGGRQMVSRPISGPLKMADNGKATIYKYELSMKGHTERN